MLTRELDPLCLLRAWDAYFSKGASEAFSIFHVFVCVALLVRWSTRLRLLEYPECLVFLQNPPSVNFTEGDVELLMSEALVLQSFYKV